MDGKASSMGDRLQEWEPRWRIQILACLQMDSQCVFRAWQIELLFSETKRYVGHNCLRLRDANTATASAHFPALKDVWVDDGSAPPSTGCLVVGVNRVRIDFTGGTSTDAKPKELAPATAPYDLPTFDF